MQGAINVPRGVLEPAADLNYPGAILLCVMHVIMLDWSCVCLVGAQHWQPKP
ncbi:hypothetical protein [Hydrogenovibrio marinus]|uniref:hypothetical protein n=1 Tax=Hydrogenovibrio marinus TaxID=28885 RepID=UPI0038CC0719